MAHGPTKQPFAIPKYTVATCDTLPQLHTTPYHELRSCVVPGSRLCSYSKLAFCYRMHLAV